MPDLKFMLMNSFSTSADTLEALSKYPDPGFRIHAFVGSSKAQGLNVGEVACSVAVRPFRHFPLHRQESPVLRIWELEMICSSCRTRRRRLPQMATHPPNGPLSRVTNGAPWQCRGRVAGFLQQLTVLSGFILGLYWSSIDEDPIVECLCPGSALCSAPLLE